MDTEELEIDILTILLYNLRGTIELYREKERKQMERNTLVFVFDPSDAHTYDLRHPPARNPTFGIVLEAVDGYASGRYLEFQYRVRIQDGSVSAFPVGQMQPLIVLPEEDAKLSPDEAFAKWAAEIVRRKVLAHLQGSTRDFLYRMNIEQRRRGYAGPFPIRGH